MTSFFGLLERLVYRETDQVNTTQVEVRRQTPPETQTNGHRCAVTHQATTSAVTGGKGVAFPCVVVIYFLDDRWVYSAVTMNHIGLIGEGASRKEAVAHLQEVVRRYLRRGGIDFAADPIPFDVQRKDTFIRFIHDNLVRQRAQKIQVVESAIFV